MDKKIWKSYGSGQSARQVAKKFGISEWRVYRSLRKAGITRRTPAESNQIIFRSKPKSFTAPANLSAREQMLWAAGLLLYMGEGSKRSDNTVDLANCDEEIVLIFLRMLREIYRVDGSRIRVLLCCHDNKNPLELIEYWSRKTKIPKTQFTKPYVKAGLRGRNSDKMKHGLIHIRYSDKKLWCQIMEDMNLLAKDLLG